MSVKDYPSIHVIRQSLRYEDGKLFWITRPREHFRRDRDCLGWNKRFSGKEAGSAHEYHSERPSGPEFRWIVKLNRQQFRRSHVVWLFHDGEWPKSIIDHRNHDTLDDHIENLRLATDSQNNANARKKSGNRSGFKGVWNHPESKRWYAKICVNLKRINLGSFATPEEAHAAYCEAARKHFGEFACEGTRS